MSGGTFFDTGILVDTLSGDRRAMAEMRRVKHPCISRVSWLEVLSGAPAAARDETEAFLGHFACREISAEIARRAATLRHDRPEIPLPAALVLATAQEYGAILVTRNTKDFPAQMPGIRIPYS
ncbi:MAG: type II toxin-antitoxin system VapC family toxin [Sphingomonadaceae bacterium]|nr:type II toxin-antitoxin system VapC family toxin [Sphingomonadaceae bacterium]